MRDFHLQFCFWCSITTALIIKDKSSKFVASNMEPGLSEEDVQQQKDTNLVITFPATKPYNDFTEEEDCKTASQDGYAYWRKTAMTQRSSSDCPNVPFDVVGASFITSLTFSGSKSRL